MTPEILNQNKKLTLYFICLISTLAFTAGCASNSYRENNYDDNAFWIGQSSPAPRSTPRKPSSQFFNRSCEEDGQWGLYGGKRFSCYYSD
ncbi:MAG: hypothetical protein SGI74_06535 [Oligoflexia bacterium]|nr:hypothetical protein [Oligoflexia bacterium]